MKVSNKVLTILAALGVLGSTHQNVAAQEEEQMTKMCLFYPNASGHARSDPILNQICPSDHVHTFYGPQNIHPNTSYEQLRDTKPKDSSSPWQENQSLYWHPSIYEVRTINGQTSYNRVSQLETSPYYRWDTTTPPETVAFPPDFRMIAYSNQDGADGGGENGENLFVECCNMRNGNESCENFVGHPLRFPKRNCDFVGIAFAMPTCWDESKGVGLQDPFTHVAYTMDGTVSGACPRGYNKRIPQVQLFVRINNYRGAQYDYQLSDGSDAFHVDFMNGWQEGKLAQIIQDCQPSGEPGYNPPCDCTQFLTETSQPSGQVCDEDVKQYILNEETAVVNTLPRGTCQGDLIEKIWDVDPPFQCSSGGNDDEPGDDDIVDDDDGGDECEDSSLEFKIKRNTLDCDWVAEKSKKRCRKALIKSHCPITCNAPEFCENDSKTRVFVEEIEKFQKCQWVKRNSAKRCGMIDMCNTCRETCAGYEDCKYFD